MYFLQEGGIMCRETRMKQMTNVRRQEIFHHLIGKPPEEEKNSFIWYNWPNVGGWGLVDPNFYKSLFCKFDPFLTINSRWPKSFIPHFLSKILLNNLFFWNIPHSMDILFGVENTSKCAPGMLWKSGIDFLTQLLQGSPWSFARCDVNAFQNLLQSKSRDT